MSASTDHTLEETVVKITPLKVPKKRDKKRCLITLKDRRKLLKEVYGAVRVGCGGKMEVYFSDCRESISGRCFGRSPQRNKERYHHGNSTRELSKAEIQKMMELTWIGGPPDERNADEL